ncbi:hypothetical protein DL96DRAFT_1818454 [Flagelloscypha sp. PMI_526]|nr:hypothetical protein DL96DRAFT_1818454 [Flagelloscypha sp. PMI_526]
MSSDTLTCRWDTCTQSLASRELLISHVVQHIHASKPHTLSYESKKVDSENQTDDGVEDPLVLFEAHNKTPEQERGTSNTPDVSNSVTPREREDFKPELGHSIPPELLRIILQLAAWSWAEFKRQQWNLVAITKADWMSWGHKIYYHDIISGYFSPTLQQLCAQLCDPVHARWDTGSQKRLALRRAAYYASLVRSLSVEMRLWQLANYGYKIESLGAKIIPLYDSLTGLEFLDLTVARKDWLHAFQFVFVALRLPLRHINLHYFECSSTFSLTSPNYDWHDLRSYITVTHLHIWYDPGQQALPTGVLLKFKSITHLAITCRDSVPPIQVITEWCTIAQTLVILYAYESEYHPSLPRPPSLLKRIYAAFGYVLTTFPKIMIWPYYGHDRKQWWEQIDESPYSHWAKAERELEERKQLDN